MKKSTFNSQQFVEFETNELDILTRVIDVPLGAFGKDELLKRSNIALDVIVSINSRLHTSLSLKTPPYDVAFSSEELILLKTIFDNACEIIDSHEMHTMTGYTWEDAKKIGNNLGVLIGKI